MSGKELLLRDKALTGWWAGVVNDPRFDAILVYAGADISTFGTIDKIAGARMALELLATFTTMPESFQPFPTAGLDHTSQPR